jgi:hypothetical protein
MDKCYFLEDNYFHLLLDDSTPPYVENIIEESKKPIMTTSIQCAYLYSTSSVPSKSTTKLS